MHDKFRVIFHTLAIGCTHLDTKKLTEISEMYNHTLSFSSITDIASSRRFFHVFLVSQRQPDYLTIIKNGKLEFPKSIFVILVEDIAEMPEIIEAKELFFILGENIEYSFHQLLQWLLILGTKKSSFINENNTISIAGGMLSTIDETYQRVDKIYKLTAKQMALIKILLEYRGEPVSREMIMEKAWNQKLVTDRIIDTNIVALRKMFGDKGRNPKYIQTIFGQGYRLTLES